MNSILLLPVLFPMISGFLLLIKKETENRKTTLLWSCITLVITGLLVAYILLTCGGTTLIIYQLTEIFTLKFHIDATSIVFASIISIVFVCAGFYSVEYMKHEDHEKRYFGFYLLTFGVLIALSFAGNIITYYLFFEMMTLLSMPLVLHNQSREAIMAALKYLLYSLCGAYMVLFGIFFLGKYATNFDFVAGGNLNASAVAGHETLLLITALSMIVGFSVKAGMFPMHAWLPTAHPVAPGPASAALSSIIVKCGILGILRVVYFVYGAEFLRGSYVQTVVLILSLITVFMGSMLAYREKVMKKRLAYSTVSQLSYIMFGLFLFQPDGLTGSYLHVIFHAFIKCTLFLVAGTIIYMTGAKNVDDMTGVGKKMPVTIWCYTLVSLALIGIPPTSGFISKWYLCIGALNSGFKVFSIIGPVILLVSALLTAGYLLPITMKGFFPGEEAGTIEKKEASLWMTIPMVILTALAVLLGMFPNVVTQFIAQIVSSLL